MRTKRSWWGALLLALAGAAHAGQPAAPPADTPEGLVRAFLADYQAWNDRAVRASETLGDERGMDAAQADYDRLLARYARPGFRGEPIAFGSDASHSPTAERVLSVDVQGAGAVVRTRHSRRIANVLLEDDYEYELKRERGRWYLEQVYYVDAEGRYPGL